MRWRWTLKVLYMAACAERNFCAEQALLKLHLALPPSGRQMRILGPIVLPPAALMHGLDAEIAGRCGV
jgi:hypothetical protein